MREALDGFAHLKFPGYPHAAEFQEAIAAALVPSAYPEPVAGYSAVSRLFYKAESAVVLTARDRWKSDVTALVHLDYDGGPVGSGRGTYYANVVPIFYGTHIIAMFGLYAGTNTREMRASMLVNNTPGNFAIYSRIVNEGRMRPAQHISGREPYPALYANLFHATMQVLHFGLVDHNLTRKFKLNAGLRIPYLSQASEQAPEDLETLAASMGLL